MTKKKYKKGFTAGVFDLFHIGHLNILRNAKDRCEYLVVGVTSDEVVQQNKNKTPHFSFDERFEIVKAIKYVDEVICQNDYSIESKLNLAKKLGIDVMFVGSDWQGTSKWNELEQKLNKIGIEVVYLPHTDGISSTILTEKIKQC